MKHNDFAERLLERLADGLSVAERTAVDVCKRACEARGIALFLVDGAVRDLQLGRASIDLDLAVEGDVAPLAAGFATELGAKTVFHARFGTAKVTGRGFHLDLAQTRRESYAHPGALPTVELVTSILDDLARRDFTINAKALRLTQGVELIDPFGGVADVSAGLMRALHDGSFRDDATRMLRAAKFAARFGFTLETSTGLWLKRDLEFINAISGPRLRRELVLIFQEAVAPDAASMAHRWGILSAIHTRLHLDDDTCIRWQQALTKRHYAPLDELGFCLIAVPKTLDDVEAIAKRLQLTAREQKALADLVRLQELSDKLKSASDLPAKAVELLDSYAKASVWALSVLDEGNAGLACRRYLDAWQAVRPELTGDDLLALGIAQGEQVGVVLRRLRQARLEGEVSDRASEIEIVRTEFGAKGGGENG